MLQVCVLAILAASAHHQAVRPTAADVLKANRDTMFALKAYSAECFTSIVDNKNKRTRSEYAILVAEKPNKMLYEAWYSETFSRYDLLNNELGPSD